MTGVDVALIALIVAIVFCTVEYREWARRDQDRRIARLRARGLA